MCVCVFFSLQFITTSEFLDVTPHPNIHDTSVLGNLFYILASFSQIDLNSAKKVAVAVFQHLWSNE